MIKKFSIFCISLYCTATFAIPTNLDIARQNVITYHDSREYYQDFARVTHAAQIFIKNSYQKVKKPAIVLDIDETSLSNYPNIIKRNFSKDWVLINNDIKQGDAPVLEDTYKLYKTAIDLKIAVFFITGRHEDLRDATIKNLRNTGFTTYEKIYLRPMRENYKNTVLYKTAIRKKIEDKGYTIIANIGDQDSDLQGGHALKTFKLPNPYYYIP